MAIEPGDSIWMGLATELLHRPDVRPDIKAQLERALDRRDPEESAEEIRTILARSATRYPHTSAVTPRVPPPREGSTSLAHQSLALVEHGLAQVKSSRDMVPQRLALFLRDSLTNYARAYDEAGQPEALEPATQVARRVLTELEAHQVPAQPARMGILTSREVAAMAAQRMTPSQAPTVRSTGQIQRDLDSWYASGTVPEERKTILKEGSFDDGEYLLALIQPTPAGQMIEVHALTSAGRPTPRPVARIEIPSAMEPISLAEVLVSPSVTEQEPLVQDRLIGLTPRAPAAGFPAFGPMIEAAVAANQARIDLYAEILRHRTDLHGAARKAAEKRLEKMEAESMALAAGSADPRAMTSSLDAWSRELARDLDRFRDRSSTPGSQEQQAGRLDALARMSALKARLDDLTASARGLEPHYGSYPGLSEQAKMLVSPPIEASSIFDTLGGAQIASATTAGRAPVAGEDLSTSVMLKAAGHTVPPSTDTRQVLKAMAAAGKRLHRALTDMASLHESGLQLSSALRPLLRPEGMPLDIRPDTRSPLLRSVLLPAMERVSGPRKAFASMGRAQGIALTPEALYGTLLGRAGQKLAERQPGVARNLLMQMGGLAQRLEQAGSPPALSALVQAGQELRQEVSRITSVSELVGDEEMTTSAVDQSLPLGSTAAAGPGLGGLVGSATSALEKEGSALTSELRNRIEPYVDIPSDTRVFSGPLATAALTEMGAQGATVGSDVYIRDDIMRSGPTAAAPILGHELVHAQKRYRSVESEESTAYRAEAAIRSSTAQLSELVKDLPLDESLPGSGKASDDLQDKSSAEEMLDDLVEKVAELWGREIMEGKTRQGNA